MTEDSTKFAKIFGGLNRSIASHGLLRNISNGETSLLKIYSLRKAMEYFKYL
jgi:hypothetical protein